MSSLQVNVMTALSRVAYDDDIACLDFLDELEHEDLVTVAYGLALMADEFLERCAEFGGIEPDVLRDSWLADLTDVALEVP